MNIRGMQDFAYDELVQDMREVIVRSSQPLSMVNKIRLMLVSIKTYYYMDLLTLKSSFNTCLRTKGILISQMICQICTTPARRSLYLDLPPFTDTVKACKGYKSKESLII